MKAPTKPAWCLSGADRARLRSILDSIGEDTTEHSPEFVRLLEAWGAVRPPWNLRPPVFAYCCRGGSWLTDGVGPVVDAIRHHVEGP